MTTQTRPVGSLTDDEVGVVLRAAIAAPSLHNSQPWQFRCTDRFIELSLDPERTIAVADPDRREAFLACGAALLNLRVAIRAAGSAADVRLLPDPNRPEVVAVVRPEGFVRPSEADRRMSNVIHRRHTSRRPFLDEPVPVDVAADLRQAARSESGWLAAMTPAQQSRLHDLLVEAHRSQRADPRFVAEFEHWTGRRDGDADGVPLRSAGIRPQAEDRWLLKDFGSGAVPDRRSALTFESDPLIAVIGSFHDLPLAWIQAGQSMQRVLLTATASGLATSFLSSVIEVASTRDALRHLLGGAIWPQAVLRLGYGSPAPGTARRPVEDVTTFEWAAGGILG